MSMISCFSTNTKAGCDDYRPLLGTQIKTRRNMRKIMVLCTANAIQSMA
jgi:hypothetical protein